MEEKAKAVIAASVAVVNFVKSHQFPVVGSPEFIELSDTLDRLESSLRDYSGFWGDWFSEQNPF